MGQTVTSRSVRTPSPRHDLRVVSARPPGPLARIRELWKSRHLVVWFCRKFTERLYANTVLGFWWVPLRPILNIVPRALIFGGVLKAPSGGVPYLLFFLVGFACWNVLDRGWYLGTRSLQMGGKYLRRIHVPRLVPVVAAVTPGVVELVLYGAFAGIVVGYYTAFGDGFPLTLGFQTLLFPVALVLILGVALSLSLWTSIIGTGGRDTRWSVRAVLNVWMLLTPVIYPLSAVPDRFRPAMELNPLTAPMEMIRTGLFDSGDITRLGLAVTAGFILAVGSLGLMVFNRYESNVLDGM